MTTIPVDLGWLILAGFILMPAMAYLASYEANRHATRHDRKNMKKQKLEIAASRGILDQLEDIRESRHRIRESMVREREVELGRKAHDLATQTHVLLRQANSRDTVPTMQEL